MDIKGMDLTQISNSLDKYLTDYFKDTKISNLSECVFVESYSFDFDEICHLIPKEHHQKFKSTDKFNGASGYLEFVTPTKEVENNEYIAMLLVNQDYSKAYLLCLNEKNTLTNKGKTVILKDFIKPICT